MYRVLPLGYQKCFLRLPILLFFYFPFQLEMRSFRCLEKKKKPTTNKTVIERLDFLPHLKKKIQFLFIVFNIDN